jgi:hypothetical protein
MKYPLYTFVFLLRDYPAYAVYKGYIGSIVASNGEDRYSIKVFNNINHIIIEVSESEIDIIS